MVTAIIIGWIGMFLALSWAVWPKASNVSPEVAEQVRDLRADACRTPPARAGRSRSTRFSPAAWVTSRRKLRAFRAELDKL
jgi:hypothetical protein